MTINNADLVCETFHGGMRLLQRDRSEGADGKSGEEDDESDE